MLGQLMSPRVAKLRRAAEEKWWDEREEALRRGDACVPLCRLRPSAVVGHCPRLFESPDPARCFPYRPPPWAEIIGIEDMTESSQDPIIRSLRRLIGIREVCVTRTARIGRANGGSLSTSTSASTQVSAGRHDGTSG